MKSVNRESPWMSVDEVAEHTRVSKETIYRWLKEKRIPAHRMEKFWRFHVDEIDAWILGGKILSKKSERSIKVLQGNKK